MDICRNFLQRGRQSNVGSSKTALIVLSFAVSLGVFLPHAVRDRAAACVSVDAKFAGPF